MKTERTETCVVLALRKTTTESEAIFAHRHEELVGLCDAAGGVVAASVAQERSDIDGRTYLGSGKVIEVAEAAEEADADVVVFDAELTPAQVRNLESVIPCRVIDRTQLILDIFALRAKSKSGRLQVEIAQLQYWLPRLTGRGREMSRLGGGIGTRGPGETKLETDRRRIRDRIARLRQELRVLQRTRTVQRDKRGRNVPVVALIGYTNAGKTTVLQRWTADKAATTATAGENRLFDTLDPLARCVKAGTTKELVLLDTVGFVQDLPHMLVDAFKSTLEEVTGADVIVHVVDGSDDDPFAHMQTTYEVLERLAALDRPVITFFNKMDKVQAGPAPDVRAQATLYGAALTGEGMAALYAAVDKELALDAMVIQVEGRSDSQSFWNLVGSRGRAVGTDLLDDSRVRVSMEVERRFAGVIQGEFERLAEAAQDVQRHPHTVGAETSAQRHESPVRPEGEEWFLSTP